MEDAMTWTWRFEAADGTGAEGQPERSQAFPTQSDAETWIGDSWRGLLDGGVDQVSLLEEDRVVYGPMSLHPEG
jgi:hypothetical protein